jgi:arylsulfatase
LLAYIDESDLSENTIVLFASDNGADGTSRGAGFRDVYDNSTGNLGSASSYVTEGFNWAQISSTPWRLVKSHPTEGGTRTPMIVRWPGKVEAGTRSSAWLRISDLKPAFLELAGGRPDKSTLPALIDGEEIYAATDARIHTYIERRLGGASVLQGQWKLAWWKENGTYIKPMLFEIGNDPMETTDIAAENSDTVAYLAEEWRRYAKIVGEGVSEANPVVE